MPDTRLATAQSTDTAVPDTPVVDITRLIEQQRPGRVLTRLVLVSWLVTFFDGFDMNSIAFVAPYLAAAHTFDKSGGLSKGAQAPSLFARMAANTDMQVSRSWNAMPSNSF